jgi:hypothetical protein
MSMNVNGGSAIPVPRPRPRPEANLEYDTYTVKKGDNLWNIAKGEFGKGTAWTSIYELNRDIIGDNPDLIEPGMNLKIRAKVTPATPEQKPEIPTAPNTPEMPSEPLPPPALALPPQVPEIPPEGQAIPHVSLVEEEAPAPLANEPQLSIPLPPEEKHPDTPAMPSEPLPPPVLALPPQAPAIPPEDQAIPQISLEEEAPAPLANEPQQSIPLPPETPLPTPVSAQAETENAIETKAQNLLKLIDGHGYSPSHHGDPVGGIPQVAKAMTELLEFYNSGQSDSLKSDANKAKIATWAADIAVARTAQSAQNWNGGESESQILADQINSRVFQALPQAQQDQILSPALLTYKFMRQKTEFSAEQTLAMEALAPHMNRLSPPEATPAEKATEKAQDLLSAYQADSQNEKLRAELLSFSTDKSYALVDGPTKTQVDQALTTIKTENLERAKASAKHEAERLVNGYQANPSNADIRSGIQQFTQSEAFQLIAPEQQATLKSTLDTIRQEDGLAAKANQLLDTIDGHGYSVAHHGDPVGGIPQVAKAMTELLDFYNSGQSDALKSDAQRQKIAQWAGDIVEARTHNAAKNWVGGSDAQAQALTDLVQSRAFQSLSPERQERFARSQQSNYEIMQSLPKLSASQQATLEALQPLMDKVKPTHEQIAKTAAQQVLAAYTAAPNDPAARKGLKDFVASETFKQLDAPSQNQLNQSLSAITKAESAEAKTRANQEGQALLSAYQSQSEEGKARGALLNFAKSESLKLVEPALQAEIQAATDKIQAEDSLEAKAQNLLKIIDGHGYSPSHHGDPVGGIPQVARAMTELLEFYNSGESNALKSESNKAKIATWAADISQARIQNLVRKWDGFSETQNQSLVQALSSRAYQNLAPEKQEQIQRGLRSTYELLQELPNHNPSQTAVLASLEPMQTRLYPPPPTPAELAKSKAEQTLADYHTARTGSLAQQLESQKALSTFANSEELALIPDKLQQEIRTIQAAETAAAEAKAAHEDLLEAQKLLTNYRATPHLPQAQAALSLFRDNASRFERLPETLQTELSTVVAEIKLQKTRQAQADELLTQIDGKGYTPSHHGDPVGGIPQVANAMTDILNFVNRGEQRHLPAATRSKMETWAADIAAARLQSSLRNWLPFDQQANQGLLNQIQSPAFQLLPPDRQQQALQSLNSQSDLLALAAEKEPSAKELETYLGQTEKEAETKPVPMVSETAQSKEFSALMATLQRRPSRSFSSKDKANAVLAQAKAVWQQQANERMAMAKELEQANYHEVLGKILAQAKPDAAIEILTQPDFPTITLMKEVEDLTASQLLIQLAQTPSAEREALISKTVDAYNSLIWDREKPFEVLEKHDSFKQLSPELQAKIKDLTAFW